MFKSRKQTIITLLVVPPILLILFIMGLYGYIAATTKPLHPDPQQVRVVTQAAPSPKWAEAVKQGQQIVRAGLTEQNLPGVSVAVGVGGDIVWAEGQGWADIDKQAPVTPVTRFRTGGTSIPLTAAAVGLLLEKDRMQLDAPIHTYVPDFPEKQWPMTVRELMGHVAGVVKDNGDEEPLFSQRCEKTGDGLKAFAERPLRSEPGTTFHYSTYGWILVSAAVEAAGGEPFFTFMRTHVFEPLGMVDTTPDIATEPITDRATFYFPRFSADTRYGHDVNREGDYSCFAGAGGILSTPSDLVRFGTAVNKLLKPETVKMLQSPQRLVSGEETGYGLGWDLESVSLGGDAVTMVGHDGEFFLGGTASLKTFPDRGIVVVVMTNTSFADTSAMALRIAEVFAAAGK